MKNKKILSALILGFVFFTGIISYVYYSKNKIYFAPKNESNLFALGQVEASKGRHLQAKEAFELLLQKDPKHTYAMRLLIESLIQIPETTQVPSWMEKMLLLDSSKENLEFAVSVYSQLGMKSEADAALEKLKQLESSKN